MADLIDPKRIMPPTGLDQIVEDILGRTKDRIIVVGPAVFFDWADGQRRHHFPVGCMSRRFTVDLVECDSVGTERAAMLKALQTIRPPVRVLTAISEHAMALLCERLWPNDPIIKEIRQHIEREQGVTKQ